MQPQQHDCWSFGVHSGDTEEGQALPAGITESSHQLRVNFLDSELFNFKQAKGFILSL